MGFFLSYIFNVKVILKLSHKNNIKIANIPFYISASFYFATKSWVCWIVLLLKLFTSETRDAYSCFFHYII